MYVFCPGFPSSAISGNPSLFMLTGVLLASSAKKKDEWLSEDGCRAGGSKRDGVSNPGVPDRLIGLEKLNAGRGSSDMLELVDGDRCWWWGEKTPALLEESLRDLLEWKEDPRTSSSTPSSVVCDLMLEVLAGKVVLGGARDSREVLCSSLRGDDKAWLGVADGSANSSPCEESTSSAARASMLALSKDEGECSLLAPK